MKRRLTSCLAVAATVFIVGLADAQETEQKKRDPSRSDQKKSIQLPAFLEDLNLSATQRQEIREAIRQHDQKTEQVWEKFHKSHWEAVELEAGLLAAAQLAGHDHAAHQDGKDDGEQARSPERNPAKNANAQEDRNDQQSSQRNEKSKQNRSPRQNASRDENPRDKNTVQDESNKSGQNDSPLDIVSLRIAVLQPGGGVREFQLNTETPPGQQECKICAACRSELSKVWQEIHNAHGQIVKLQADKMVAIESKLTEKQLAQLQDDNPNHADHKKKTGETQ